MKTQSTLIQRVRAAMRSKTQLLCAAHVGQPSNNHRPVIAQIIVPPQREPIRLPDMDEANRYNGRRHSRRNNGQKPRYKKARRVMFVH